MKIIHVPRRFTQTHWGGTETVILQTCRQQAAKGHKVSIETSMALAPNREDTIEGIPVHRHSHFYPWFGLDDQARLRLDQKGGNLFSIGLMQALAKEPKLDLIHLHTAKRVGGIVRKVAHNRKIPYVISVHGGLLDVPASEAATFAEPTQGKREWGKALGWWVGSRRVFDDAGAILCLGDEELARVSERYPSVKAVKFPNGVDADRFATGDGDGFRLRHGIPSGVPLILVMGRIDGQKNQLLAVEALEALKQAGQNPHLLLIGHVTNDAYRDSVVASIEERGLTQSVTLIPGLPAHSNDLQDAYHAADIFLLPSIHEPFGIVILEAWAAGLPVVASRVGGVPSFVADGQDGILFPSNDSNAVIAAISSLLSTPSQAQSLADAGKRKANDEYSWSSVTDRLMTLYEEVISAHPLR